MTVTRPTEIATLAEVISYLGYGENASDAIIGQLQNLKRSAEMSIRKFLRCNVTQATYTHYLPRGNPFDLRSTGRLIAHGGAARRRTFLGPQILLPEYPLRSITSINEDRDGRFGQISGAFDSDSLLTEGSDYMWPIEATGFGRRAAVVRLDTYWPSDPGSIKVVYVAGWTAAELHGDTTDTTKDASPIRLSVLKTVGEFWADKKQAEAGADGAPGPIKSESLADYSVAYDTTSSGAGVQLPKDVRDELRDFRRLSSVRVTM